MINSFPADGCNARRRHRPWASRFVPLDRAQPLLFDPRKLEEIAGSYDPTPVLDTLLDLLDDPDTPPDVAAMIRDWIDS